MNCGLNVHRKAGQLISFPLPREGGGVAGQDITIDR